MSVINEIAAAIRRNPKIKRVIVSARELEQMRVEYLDLLPGGGPPASERHFTLANMRLHGFQIMGCRVESREALAAEEARLLTDDR